jgi:DNA repair protein RadC
MKSGVNRILHINNEDLALTRAVMQAGKLLDIILLDHLVIGWGRFVSIKEKNAGSW